MVTPPPWPSRNSELERFGPTRAAGGILGSVILTTLCGAGFGLFTVPSSSRKATNCRRERDRTFAGSILLVCTLASIAGIGAHRPRAITQKNLRPRRLDRWPRPAPLI